jgi:hypothetical protein
MYLAARNTVLIFHAIQPRQIQSGPPPFGNRELGRPHVILPRPGKPPGKRMTTTRPPTTFRRLAPARACLTRKRFAAFNRDLSGRHRHSRRGHRKRRQQHGTQRTPAKNTANSAASGTHGAPKISLAFAPD